jgi:hypothetical protein
MSYLAISAAPINNDNNQSEYPTGETPINKKRQNHNKTQKYRQPSSDFNPQKVNSVLQSIHNNTADDDDDLGNYNFKGTVVTAKHSDDFKPINPFEFPSKPVSMGSERKKMESMSNMDNSLVPQPTDNDDLKLQELQSAFMNDALLGEIQKLREEKRDAQKELRKVRLALREDKEMLGSILFIFNTFLIPILLMAFYVSRNYFKKFAICTSIKNIFLLYIH